MQSIQKSWLSPKPNTFMHSLILNLDELFTLQTKRFVHPGGQAVRHHGPAVLHELIWKSRPGQTHLRKESYL